MGNMSHCRFRNTLNDLLDCEEKLEEMDGDFRGLSEAEGIAARRLILVCGRINDQFLTPSESEK